MTQARRRTRAVRRLRRLDLDHPDGGGRLRPVPPTLVPATASLLWTDSRPRSPSARRPRRRPRPDRSAGRSAGRPPRDPPPLRPPRPPPPPLWPPRGDRSLGRRRRLRSDGFSREIGFTRARIRASPRPIPNMPLAGLVDDLVLELVLDDAEAVERELLGVVDRSSGDLDPIHVSALSLLLLARRRSATGLAVPFAEPASVGRQRPPTLRACAIRCGLLRRRAPPRTSC